MGIRDLLVSTVHGHPTRGIAAALATVMLLDHYARASSTGFHALVDGVTEVSAAPGQPGPVFPLSPDARVIVSGDGSTSFPSSYAVAVECGNGRVIGIGHPKLFEVTEDFDNGRFVDNILGWVTAGSGSTVIAYTTGHGEFNNAGRIAALQSWADRFGYTLASVDAPIGPSDLSGIAGIVVFNAWSDFTTSELDAIEQWVLGGGGLMIGGLGWSFATYQNENLDLYPINILAERFGLRWISGGVFDGTDGVNGLPIFNRFYPDAAPLHPIAARAAIQAVHGAHGPDLPQHLADDPALAEYFLHALHGIGTALAEVPVASIRDDASV